MHKDVYDGLIVKNWKCSKVELQDMNQINYDTDKLGNPSATLKTMR